MKGLIIFITTTLLLGLILCLKSLRLTKELEKDRDNKDSKSYHVAREIFMSKIGINLEEIWEPDSHKDGSSWSSEYMLHLYKVIERVPVDSVGADITVNAYKPTKSEYSRKELVVKYDFEYQAEDNAPQMIELVFEPSQSNFSKPCTYIKSKEIPASICTGKNACFNISMQLKIDGYYLISDITNFVKNLDSIMITLQVGPSWSCLGAPVLVAHSINKHIYYKYSLPKDVHSRLKRAVTNHSKVISEKDLESPCNLIPWELNFKDLGWSSWIVQPEQCTINMCLGKCHTDDELESSKINQSTHAFLLQRYYQTIIKQDPKEAELISKATCVPIRTSSMSILLHRDDIFTITHKNEMIATDCGCL